MAFILNFFSDARDAIAKILYGRLFSWIVNKVNCLLATQEFLSPNEANEIGKFVVIMTTPLRCGQYCFCRFLCVSEFSFSHLLAQTAAWNLIKIAHNVYLTRLSR
jgi:hypothetical protein